MKRANYLLNKIAEPDNIREAAYKAAKGKRNGALVQLFFLNLNQNVVEIRKELINGNLKLKGFRYFVVFEPKERKIAAPHFRDQVIHHSIMNICHSSFEKNQIFDSYASRKNKGTYACLDRAFFFSGKYQFYCKMDVRKYFETISHTVVLAQMEKLFKEKGLIELFAQIVDSYHSTHGRGLPIGSLSSQYLTNHYLCSLDHFIKEKLRIKAYCRYMDDMVIWSNNKAELLHAEKEIAEYVTHNLLVSLKPSILNSTKVGLPFLGYRVFPNTIRLNHLSKHRFIRKNKKLTKAIEKNEISIAEAQRKILPLLAFIQKADTLAFRKRIFLDSDLVH